CCKTKAGKSGKRRRRPCGISRRPLQRSNRSPSSNSLLPEHRGYRAAEFLADFGISRGKERRAEIEAFTPPKGSHPFRDWLVPQDARVSESVSCHTVALHLFRGTLWQPQLHTVGHACKVLGQVGRARQIDEGDLQGSGVCGIGALI